MKKIITHLNPDLDAVTSIWLIKRFLPASQRGEPGWEEAKVEFVNAGASTEKNPKANADPNVLWVDVGRGKLDHHQTGEYLSAAKLCLDYIQEKRRGQKLAPLEEKVLERIVIVVTEVDNVRDIYWPEVGQDRYLFSLYNMIEGLGWLGKTNEEVVDFGMRALDAILVNLKHKLRAKEKLEEGIRFQTPWGEAIAIEVTNKQILWQGQVQGFVLAVGKDPRTGAVRIYARPDAKVDLTKAYQKFKKMDPESDWFLHASKECLLNQSSVDPKMRSTKLGLDKIIEVLKEG